MSLALPMFFVSQIDPGRAPEQQDPAANEQAAQRASFLSLLRNRRFLVHTLCYSVIGGVSFAIPGIQDSIFSSCLSTPNWSSSQTIWTNFSFIACGVISGLIIGYTVHEPSHQARTIR